MQRVNLVFFCVITLLGLTACAGSGPTSRTTDGDWRISENICSSDSKNPDLGDMRSVFKLRSNGLNGERIVNFYHLERTILSANNKFTRGGMTGKLMLYENSDDNPLVETKNARNGREVNAGIQQGVIDFFKNDPNIDGEKASSYCLYRGQ